MFLGVFLDSQGDVRMATLRLDNPSLEEITSSFADIPIVDGNFKLKFVMFFGRHGARTPIRTMPNVEQVSHCQRVPLA